MPPSPPRGTAERPVYHGRVKPQPSPVEARHRALVDALPDLVLRLRADGTYLEIAGDITKLHNPPDNVVGSTVWELLPPQISEQLMSCVTASLESGALATVEYSLRTVGGDERDFEVRVAPAGPDEVVAVVRDVSDLRTAMSDLRESRARIVAAGDEERRRVERNLHDGAQQRLVTVALHLHLVKRRLENDPAAVAELVDAAQTELTLALEEIRELVRGLHPRLLSERGLEPALAGLAERSVLPVQIAEIPEERLPQAVEAAAYYVVAEALANAAKHSGASLVTVRVSAGESCTRVEVVDDGAGGADPAGGSGLSGLADRVAALGGTLDVHSPIGTGTTISTELPHDHPQR
jgi:signal transduction histidine kinase